MADDDDSLVIELSSDDEDIKHIFETKRTANKPSTIKALQDYLEIHEYRRSLSGPGTSNGYQLPPRQTVLIPKREPTGQKIQWLEALGRKESRNKASRGDRVNYSNCGIHSDDTLNVPDENGQVLVNVDHPNDEPNVFFAPQLARALKPHQVGGIRFLYDNIIKTIKEFNTTAGQGCILAHSMGLGKTIQLCSFIDVFITDLKGRHVLCVVPVNTLQNWLSEFDMWLPTRECYHGSDPNVRFRRFDIYSMAGAKSFDARVSVLKKWQQNGGVLLIGYELFRILTMPRKKGSQASGTSSETNHDSNNYYVDSDSESCQDIRSYLIPPPGSKYNNQTNQAGKPSRSGSSRAQAAQTIIRETLLDPGPDLVVCDEGHRIKNSKAATSIALKQIATKRRVVLTGYPLQNNMIEYWCMVDFVKPGYLGSQRDFTVVFDKPITAGQCVDSTTGQKREMRYRAHVLHRVLERFVQRRSHSLLKNHLPRKHEYVILVRMTEIQRALIRGFIEQIKQDDLRTKDNKLRVNPLLLFAISCKIWNHPDIFHAVVKDARPDVDLEEMQQMMNDDQASNARSKMMLDIEKCSKNIPYDWAHPLLDNYSPGLMENSYKVVLFFFILNETLRVGDRILLFSQSLLTLDLIEEFLSSQNVPYSGSSNKRWRRDDNYYRLDGTSTPYERERYIDSFNKDPRYKLFLISTRAGSLGINLTGANRIVIFDASWNPCHDAQAACRVFRYGQKKECYIYRFVCDNTMERRIYDRQINKQGMANRVVDQLNHESKLTWSEITQLVLDFDGHSDPPPVDMSEKELNDISDPLVKAICREYKYAVSAAPFEHESLLLDHEETKLTETEKRVAEELFKKAPMNPNLTPMTVPPQDMIDQVNMAKSFILNQTQMAAGIGGIAAMGPMMTQNGVHLIDLAQHSKDNRPLIIHKVDPSTIQRPPVNMEPEVIDISD